jgi:hypothetical protein
MPTYTLALVADATRSFVKWAAFSLIGADPNAEYVLVGADANLPNSRTITAGSGVTLTDGGAGSTLTIAATSSGTATNSFPHVDLCAAIGGTADGPAFTATIAGTMFCPNVVGSVITGVRFLWTKPSTATPNVICSLWRSSTKLATGTVTAPGTGIQVATFTSPYTVLASDTVATLVVSVFAPVTGGGGYYCNVNGPFQTICNSQSNNTVPVAPVLANPYWRYQGGDNTPEYVFGVAAISNTETAPTSKYGQSTYFAIEPVIT